jgi:hypothetical protein
MPNVMVPRKGLFMQIKVYHTLLPLGLKNIAQVTGSKTRPNSIVKVIKSKELNERPGLDASLKDITD